ncbi:MAG: 50S ribosomal protein L29 [bacterium]
MKAGEIRDLTQDELGQKEQELVEELFNLKIQHATGQLENTARIGQVRRDIARIKTVLRERQGGKGERDANQ